MKNNVNKLLFNADINTVSPSSIFSNENNKKLINKVIVSTDSAASELYETSAVRINTFIETVNRHKDNNCSFI